MPYHLLYGTQAAKDRLLAHRVQATCMAPVLFPNQKQHTTLSKSTTDTAPIAPSLPKQLHASQDALLTAALRPHPPAPQQTLKDTLPTPRSLLPSPLKERIPSVSSPLPHMPLRTLSPTTSPLFMISIIIIIFILLVILEFRFLEAHASLFDRFDNWFRRFHKGTSRFRLNHQQPAGGGLPASELNDDRTRHAKPKRRSGQLGAPGWMVKNAVVSAGKWVKWAVRSSMQRSEGSRGLVIRSFDGQPVAPVARRPWGIESMEGPSMGYTSLPPLIAVPLAPIAEQIAYGVPPAIKPARGRRTTIASRALEPEAAVEGPASNVTSVLRQQAIADDEVSTASRGTVDPLMMRMPRGDDGWEERDLEALEGRSVRVNFGGRRGVEDGLALRRVWNGDGGAGGAGGGEIV